MAEIEVRSQIGLHLHYEPAEPLELTSLLSALQSLGQRYENYAKNVLKSSDGNKLFVSSIKPGSIDISLIPELYEFAQNAVGIATATGILSQVDAVVVFARSIEQLLNKFSKQPPDEGVTVKDCDQAANIVQPTVESGGTQNITVMNIAGNPVFNLNINLNAAEKIYRNANTLKALLKMPETKRRNSVALVWKTFDRSLARQAGRSPDKAFINEIESVAKSVLFGEDEAGLKADILNAPENPMSMVYYVDVEIITIGDKVNAYRVVGYHGKEPLPDEGTAEAAQ